MLLQWQRGNRQYIETTTFKHASIEVEGYRIFFHYVDKQWRIRVPASMKLIEEKKYMFRQTYLLLFHNEEIMIHLFPSDTGYKKYIKKRYVKTTISIGGGNDQDIQCFDEEVQGTILLLDIASKSIQLVDGSVSDLYCEEELLKSTYLQVGKKYTFLNFTFWVHDDFIMINQVDNFICTLEDHSKTYLTHDLSNIPKVQYWFDRQEGSSIEEYEVELHIPPSVDPIETRPLFLSIGTSLIMTMGTLVMSMITSYEQYIQTGEILITVRYLILPCTMLLGTLVFMPMNRLWEMFQINKKKKKREKELQEEIDKIHENYESEKEKRNTTLERIFPLPLGIYRNIVTENKASLVDSLSKDFLHIRCGTCHMPYPLHILPKMPVSSLPSEILTLQKENWAHPFLLNLKEIHFLQVIDKSENKELEKYILLQLVSLFSPEDLSIHYFSDKIRYPLFEKMYHLKDEMGHYHMHSIKEKYPLLDNKCNITNLCICFDKKVAQFLQQHDQNIIYFSEDTVAIFDNIIEFNDTSGEYYKRSTKKKIQFVFEDKTSLLFEKILSYLLLDPTKLLTKDSSFLEVHQNDTLTVSSILEQWECNHLKHHLISYVGFQDSKELMCLDLHESGDGPHGLIAGMTGSGKSEFVITMLFSLLLRYSYKDLQIAIIDFKGGSIFQSLQYHDYLLPHIVGYLSNLDISEMERSLIGLSCECTYRETLFSKLHSHTNKPIDSIDTYQQYWTKECNLPYLGHLLIVVDEFAELKKDRPEFLEELIRIARVGRSLGMHLLLITQRPSSSISQEIRSNTSFQICLKVQEEQDSIEVIKNKEAAYLKETGECLLLSHNQFTKGKSFYCNHPYHDESVYVYHQEDKTFHSCLSSTISEREKILQILSKIHKVDLRQLWLPPIDSVDITQCKEDTIGILDNYYARTYDDFILPNSFVVCGTEKDKKYTFLVWLLYVLRSTNKVKEVFLLVNNKKEYDFSFCNAIITYDQKERLEILQEHIFEENGLISIVIEDINAFLKEELNEELFQGWLKLVYEKKINLYIGMYQVNDLKYSYLSHFSKRIVLDIYDPIQISSFLNAKVKQKDLLSFQGLTNHQNHILPFTFPKLQEGQLSLLDIDDNVNKYTIFEMEDKVMPLENKHMLTIGREYKTCKYVEVEEGSELLFVSNNKKQLDKLDRYYNCPCFQYVMIEDFQNTYIQNKKIPIVFLGNTMKQQFIFPYTKNMKMKEEDAIYVRSCTQRKIKMIYVE